MFGRVGRVHYSTGVTQDFLQSILARAQEATAKKAAPPKPRKGNDRKFAKNSGGPNRRRNDQQKTSGSVTPRVKPTFNHSIVNRQPQFERKSAANAKTAVAGEELIDAFDMKGDSAKEQSKNGKSVIRRKPQRSRDAAGLAKRTRNSDKAPVVPPVKNNYSQEAYVPQEPTVTSLLKFFPGLPNTPTSRLINYSLELMQSADFPLYRRANYGYVENPQDAVRSMTYTLKTPYFGQYTGSMPLTFEKERLFKNLTVEGDKAKFDSIVLGNYQNLAPVQKDDFKSIAKQDEKRGELTANSNVVRRSLQGINIDAARKQAVYQVCSGLKPIAELTH